MNPFCVENLAIIFFCDYLYVSALQKHLFFHFTWLNYSYAAVYRNRQSEVNFKKLHFLTPVKKPPKCAACKLYLPRYLINKLKLRLKTLPIINRP